MEKKKLKSKITKPKYFKLNRDVQRALGHNNPVPDNQSVFFENSANFWNRLEKPQPGEWLAEHQETGQTYDQFLMGKAVYPVCRQKTIVIKPLDPEITPELLEYLTQLCQAYFMPLPVKVAKYKALESLGVESRYNPNFDCTQYHANQIIDKLVSCKPKDAFCIVGVTMKSLYPHEDWNFVYGLAASDRRAGVFSFKSYSSTTSSLHGLMYRAGKTLTHEIGHLFGIKHWVYYRCNMSGVNNGQEGKKYPPYLCPIWLRKLQQVLKFDIIERYQALQSVTTIDYESFQRLNAWYTARIEHLTQNQSNECTVIPVAAPNSTPATTVKVNAIYKCTEEPVAAPNSIPATTGKVIAIYNLKFN